MIEIDGTALHQWDVGRRVVVTGIEVEYVHFANQGDSKAVIMGAVDIHAQIPDFLLQSGKQLCVYAVKDGITVESKTFYVKKRERPENYIYEDDQRNYIYDLVTRAEEAIESMWWAYQDVSIATENANLATENANASATSANQAAENANASANSANQAAGSANLAAEYANEAAAKAAHTAKSLMVVGAAKGNNIYLDDAIDQFFVGMRIFGKTTQDGTPTPDAPVELDSVGDGGSARVTVFCKNLLENTAVNNSINGVTFTVNTDGSITANGTATKDVYCRVGEVICELGSRYTLSGAPITANVNKFFLYKSTANVAVDSGSGVDFYALEEINEVYIKVLAGATLSNDTFYPMVRLSSVIDSTYDQYKGQTLTAFTPNGLRGIPVSTGGNYTDANGQRWICDEIDFARGVYAQRISMLIPQSAVKSYNNNYGTNRVVVVCADAMYSAGNVAGAVMCDSLPTISANDQYVGNESSISNVYGSIAITFKDFTTEAEVVQWLVEHPIKILYALATPIETPLSAEELAAFASLRTYRGNTTVSNDASAHMEIEYVMDAKKYIDSMIHPSARIANVSLPASKWVGSGNLYSQVVSIAGITENSQVNLNPSVEQLSIFYEKDLTFITENDGGVVTVYVIGQKPQNDYTIQADIVEVRE